MNAAQLRHFADFRRFPAAELEALADRVRRLRVPSGRWLVRPGRVLATRVFLLEGRVRLLESGRSVIVSAGSGRARRAVYPGSAGVETLTASVFLSVDPAALEPPPGGLDPGARPGMPEVREDGSWQQRFLTSPLMQGLDPVVWQRVLRAMSRQEFPAGAAVIREGESADCCYVLCRGRAEIRAGRTLLAILEPGRLFGEDALVSGHTRNASVTMVSAGSAAGLPAAEFRAWLLEPVVQPLADAGTRPLINLGPESPAAALNVAADGVRHAARRLDAAKCYAIVGGTWVQRALVAFLLAEQGIRAGPVRGS